MNRIKLILLILCLKSFQSNSQTSFSITNTGLVPSRAHLFVMRIEEDVNKQRFLVISTTLHGSYTLSSLGPAKSAAFSKIGEQIRSDAKLIGQSFDEGYILDNIAGYLNSQPSIVELQDRQYNSCSINREVTEVSITQNAPNFDVTFDFELRFQFKMGNQAAIDSPTRGLIANAIEAEMRTIEPSFLASDFSGLTTNGNQNDIGAKYASIANLPVPYSGSPTPVNEAESPNQLNFGIGLGIASTLKKTYSYYVSKFDTTLQQQELTNPFFTASFTLSWTPNFTYLDEVRNAYYEAPGWLGACLSLNISDVDLTDSAFNPRINGGIGIVIRPRSRVEFGVLCDFIRWDVLNDFENKYIGQKYTIDPKNELVPSLFTKQTIPSLSLKVIFRISDFRMDNYRLRNSGDPAR